MGTIAPSKPRGRPPGRGLTAGNCTTRDVLVERVRWYYAHTSMSAEAIALRFDISQSTALKILR